MIRFFKNYKEGFKAGFFTGKAFTLGLVFLLGLGTGKTIASALDFLNEAKIIKNLPKINEQKGLPGNIVFERNQTFRGGFVDQENIVKVLNKVMSGKDTCEIGGIYGYRNGAILCTEKTVREREVKIIGGN